jgi:hypothetical protein
MSVAKIHARVSTHSCNHESYLTIAVPEYPLASRADIFDTASRADIFDADPDLQDDAEFDGYGSMGIDEI